MRRSLLRRERIHNVIMVAETLDEVALYNNLIESYTVGVWTSHFNVWLSFNSYPRLCVSICYIVKLSIDILWCSFHGRAINQYNSIFCLCHCWLNWNWSNQFGVKDWDHTVTIIGPSSGETVLLWFVWWLGKIIVYHSWGWFVTYQSRRTWLGDDHP